MRFIVIIAAAALLMPRAQLESIANAAMDHGRALVTICDRRPDDCQEFAETIKSASLAAAEYSTAAAQTLRSGLDGGIVRIKSMHEDWVAARAPDRGTLSDDDLAPAWRGH